MRLDNAMPFTMAWSGETRLTLTCILTCEVFKISVGLILHKIEDRTNTLWRHRLETQTIGEYSKNYSRQKPFYNTLEKLSLFWALKVNLIKIVAQPVDACKKNTCTFANLIRHMYLGLPNVPYFHDLVDKVNYCSFVR